MTAHHITLHRKISTLHWYSHLLSLLSLVTCIKTLKMKKQILLFTLGMAMLAGACSKQLHSRSTENKSCNGTPLHPFHPLKDSIESILSRYIQKGLPGIQVTVKNKQGWYATSAGYANAETKDTLMPCAPGWYFSLTKTYTAALIMMEKEKGNIDLDKSITHYLPLTITNKIKGAEKITVRMLLNHSSGLMNFTDLPEYLGRQFSDPTNQPTVDEMIDMSANRELISEPGKKYFYSNTNYLLLYALLQHSTGKSYSELLKERITEKHKLTETYYNVSPDKASSMGFPHYYADLQGKDLLSDVTTWNHFVGNASYGWGGIAGTPTDAIKFYEALMKGKIVNKQSLNEMITWFKEEGSEYPSYGLGIEYWQFRDGSTPQRGHEGDGIGNSTMILYVPDNDTYVFINTTAGRKIPGPYLFKVTDLKNELGRFIASWR